MPWGEAIIPKYNSLLDDPRRHALYLDQRMLAWLRGFPDTPDVLVPVAARAVEADFYDGLGTLLPLGVYWHLRAKSQSFQMWSMASCFDFIAVARLIDPDETLRAYMACLQMPHRDDDMRAFKDYVKLRQEPDYWTAHCYSEKFTLPDFCINGLGEVINETPAEHPEDDFSMLDTDEWEFI